MKKLITYFMLGMFIVSGIAFAQNTYETAEELPVNEDATVEIDDSQNAYWWSLATTNDGTLVITAEADESLEYNLFVYDSRNCEVDNVTEAGTRVTMKLDELSEGKYYIKFERRDGSGEFTIFTDFSSSENNAESSNSGGGSTSQASETE